MPDLDFDNSTRTLTVSVKSGSSDFYFWAGGKKFIKTTSQTVSIPDTTDTYFIYFDTLGVLQYISHSSIPEAIFYNYTLTALIRWNSVQGSGGIGDERHGVRMSGATHEEHHRTIGAAYESGFDIEGLTNGSTTFTQITSGYMFDEDIRHNLNAVSSIPTFYMLGADNDWYVASGTNEVGYKESGDTYYSYNYWDGSEWTLREGNSSTDYYIIFFAQNPSYNGNGAIRILGQNAYSSRTNARNAIESELNKLKLDGLPSPEILFTQAIIIKRDGKVQTLADGSLYVDLRVIKGGSGGASNSSDYADDIITDTTNFDGNLSSTDTSVQIALDTLDDMTLGISNIVDDTTPQLGGNLDLNENDIVGSGNITCDYISPAKNLYFATEYDNENSSTAWTLYDYTGSMQLITLTADNTITMSKLLTGVSKIQLRVVQDATGGWDMTWPSTVLFPEGEPTWTDGTAGQKIILSMYFMNGEYVVTDTGWYD